MSGAVVTGTTADPVLPVCVAIDFETSGYEAGSACAIGLVRLEAGRVADRFSTLLRPPSSRVLFTEIHGLTWAMLREAPVFADIWPRVHAFLEGARWLLAHNAGFDRRVLYACCKAAGVDRPPMPFLCTLKGARRSLPLPSRRLNSVCEYFGIPLRHHDAASDAEACAHVYMRLRERGVSDAEMRLK